MGYLNFVIKSTIYGGGIIGVGYLLMKATVPSADQMAKRLEESGRQIPHNMTDEQKKIANFYRVIQENAKSDRPVWDVRWPEESQGGSQVRNR